MSPEMQVINNANLLFRDINKCFCACTALKGGENEQKTAPRRLNCRVTFEMPSACLLSFVGIKSLWEQRYYLAIKGEKSPLSNLLVISPGMVTPTILAKALHGY